ncbi:MFS transporter [Haloglomus litoreum]|uniref:MFS transporter n=1 Tax=Haloglomus litoreum TaxID=3034026 RepID=UPI0023E79E8B|nr:MFS transporter [Haloglomus sp. DT116]
MRPRELVGLLRNRDFALLVGGRLVTNAGDSLYYIAAMWLVYDLTGSELFTGLAGFLTMAPAALQFLFGPLVDRTPLERLLVGTQVVQGLLVLVVPAAHYLGVLSVWVVLTVMPLLSLLNQPVYPAQSAALPRIVDRDELVGANSVLTLAYQGVNAGFNALGGVVVAAFGAVTLFLVDSVTFAVATMLFLGLNIPEAGAGDIDDEGSAAEDADEAAADGEAGDPAPVADGGRDEPGDRTADPADDADADAPAADDPAPDAAPATEAPETDDDDGNSYLEDLREGIGFLRGTVVAKLTLGVIIVNFAFGGVMAILPSYGDSFGGAGAYGLLAAAVGVGMLAGSLVGNLVEEWPFGYVVSGGMAVSAVLWTAAIAVDSMPATPVLLALALVPAGTMNVLVFSLVQAVVPDRLLGRAMSVIRSGAGVMTPVGALVGGAVADATSPGLVLYGNAVATAVFALYVFALPSLRRIPRVGSVSTLVAE